MATDYSKLKNAELESLLKERALPLGGKKADMVARLQEDDQKPSSTAVPASLQADVNAATTAPAAAAVAAGGTAARAPNPVDVPNQAPAIDPAATSELSVAKDTTTSASAPLNPTNADASAEATGESKPVSTFTSNLAPTDLDAEIAKRKARAAKFGISESENDAIRALERAKRFGTGMPGEQKAGEEAEAAEGTMGMRRLDEALPERRERKRGRAPGGDAYEDEGLRKRKGRAFWGPKGGRVEKTQRGGGTSWMSEADRAAAEKRKNRFTATAT